MADNLAIARRWFHEVWTERREQTIYELMHPECCGETNGGCTVGPDAWKKSVYDPFRAAFTDIKVDVEDMIAQGDRVAVRWRLSMKHATDALGFPASGRTVETYGLTWLEIQDGKITKGWDGWDSTGLLLRCGGGTLHPALAPAAG
jgi:steroid delta-isomerase-like uncharacterized protein